MKSITNVTKRYKLPAVTFTAGVIVTVIFYKLSSSSSDPCIDWSKISPDSMSGNQIIEYFKWTNSWSCRMPQYFGGKYQWLFNKDGEKVVCLDSQVKPVSESCIVYSFGINDEWSFDEAMEKYGCNVFAFDPFMELGSHQHSKRISFHKMGLGFDGNSWDLVQMRSLSSIYKMLRSKHGDVVIDYLKIDIEGYEWNVIENIIASGMLSKIRQMGMEIHMWPVNGTIIHHRSLVKMIQLLETNGMVRFNSQINPVTYRYIDAFGFKDYTCYEIAWYNSHHYRTSMTN